MSGRAGESGRERPGIRLPRRVGFVAAASMLGGVFLASGTPVPLYARFRVDDHITNADLALTTVAYLVATALSLLVLGRLSDHVGRRPVALVAGVLAIAGLIAITQVHSLPMLLIARMLQGAACGLASSGIASWVIDLAPARPRWLPALLTGTLPPFALPIGAIVAGALVQYGPATHVLMYAVTALVLAVLVVMLVGAPDVAVRRPGAWRSLVPRVYVPEGGGALLFAVGAAQVATWSFSGFYQAFSPAITVDHLGTSNSLVIAIVFASAVLLSPIGGLWSGRMRRHAAMRIGLATFVIAAAIVVVALRMGLIVPFLTASFVVGIALGFVSASGLAALLATTEPGDRAGLMSTVYLISYAGAAIPSLVAGQLAASAMDVSDIAVGYLVLLTAAALAAVVVFTPRRAHGDAPR